MHLGSDRHQATGPSQVPFVRTRVQGGHPYWVLLCWPKDHFLAYSVETHTATVQCHGVHWRAISKSTHTRAMYSLVYDLKQQPNNERHQSTSRLGADGSDQGVLASHTALQRQHHAVAGKDMDILLQCKRFGYV